IGYPPVGAGYDGNTFDASDCIPSTPTGNDCPAFDRLVGSRMLIGNLEFRFPLLRPFGVSRRMYGPLPMEVALFADGGVAWTSTSQPIATTALNGLQTRPFSFKEGVASAGVALRVNFFGFDVG